MEVGAYITSYLRYDERLDEKTIRDISGALLNNGVVGPHADLVYTTEVELDVVPAGPVIKMAHKEHVEGFFHDGTLRLGTYREYARCDDPEIGDPTEGSFVLVGQTPNKTAFAEVGGGFHHYVFATYAGEPDPELIRDFGYDAHFEIVDVEGFTSAVGQCLGFSRHRYAECAYSKDKVVVGEVTPAFDFNRVSARLLELVSIAKYFVKPDRYSNQCEFRFVWQMDEDVGAEPLILDCPEARQFCRRPKE